MILNNFRNDKNTFKSIEYEGQHFDFDDKTKKLDLCNKQKIMLLYQYDKDNCITDKSSL